MPPELPTAVLDNVHPALRRCWLPAARSADVTAQPLRAVLLGEPWVLVRIGGVVRAFADRCPHRLAPLSLGHLEGAHLRCGYHGWCFDSEGRCVDIPALGPGAPVPPRAHLSVPAGLAERDGMVFLAPEEPVGPLGTVAEAADPRFQRGDIPVVTAKASAALLADNFLDMAHFPFVHAATFGAEDPLVPPFEVARDGLGFVAVNEHEFVNREDPAVAAGIRPLVQRRRLTYRVRAPFHLVLRIDFLDSGGTNVIGFFLQPESERSCRIYSTLWRDDLEGDAGRMAAAIAFEEAVIAEDLRLQEAYDTSGVPLDITAELHTRADRSTVEYRRTLADLVVATGGVVST